MSMMKPISVGVDAFDSTKSKTFTFTSVGGNQVVKNRLVITNSLTNVVEYDKIIETFEFKHTVEANTLSNNNQYYYYFITYDAEGNASESSDYKQFFCYATPSLYITNFPTNSLVNNSSYSFNVEYNQTEGELLKELQFYLYDEQDKLIDKSGKYNGTDTLPANFEHTFSGFNNNENYKIQVIAYSINGTETKTDLYVFSVRYYFPEIFSLLDLQNNQNYGYVNIESNMVVLDGKTNSGDTKYLKTLEGMNTSTFLKWNTAKSVPSNKVISKWAKPTKLDVHNYNDCVKWENCFSVSSNFTMSLFCEFGRLGEFARLGDDLNGFRLIWKRGLANKETTPKDWIELQGFENGEQKVSFKSNTVRMIGTKSKVNVWLRKVGYNYTLKLTVLKYDDDAIEWGKTFIESGKTTTISWNTVDDKNTWKEESYNKYYLNNYTESMDYAFPLNSLYLFNGIYDNIDITLDTAKAFNTEISNSWDYKTKVNCDFNGNMNGGNMSMLLSQVQYIRIKRRKRGDFKWVTLYEIPINSYEDLSIVKKDYFVPSRYEAEYALVPVMYGGTEGEYIINDIKTCFNTTVIANKDKSFNFISNVSHGSEVRNQNVITYSTLSGKYPIVSKNSESDYWSGTFSANFLGNDFMETRKIDADQIKKETEELCEFINDPSAKIIKDWNGKIRLVRFNGSPTITYNQQSGNIFGTFSCNWVEQGQFDNQDDLISNGLTFTHE